MKNIIKLLSLSLAVIFVFVGCKDKASEEPKVAPQPNTYQGVVFENGGIKSDYGINTETRKDIIRTKGFLRIDDLEKIEIGEDYVLGFVMYREKDLVTRVSSSGWVEAGTAYTVERMRERAPQAVYFRFQIKHKSDDGREFPIDTLDEAGLNIVGDFTGDDNNSGQDHSKKKSDFTYKNVCEINASSNGPWQEGAIFDGKLFLLNHAEEGAVYSLADKKRIADFTFDRTDLFSPHANSMCFGSQYYDESDKYPLLYVSVYNNYANFGNRYEGTCGVYRVLENDSGFSAELVQVIKIGFTEDLNLWKSLENNKDVCPYGNFIVDTDNNQLYAYVMRDADRTTRFFKFDVPAIGNGEQNPLIGCNMVTLGESDIKDQFDTQYFTYLQGADYVGGMLLSVEGLGFASEGGAALRVVDLKSKELVKTYEPITAGVYNEPEVLAVDPETKKVYYGASDGQLRELTCIEKLMSQ